MREDRTSLLVIEVDKANSRPGAPDALPNPTFLVANTAPTASDSFYFAHSATNLTGSPAYLFASGEGFLLPSTRGGSNPGHTALVPTGTAGTYAVKWIGSAASDPPGSTSIWLASWGGSFP